jgi:hypothetical protein
MFHFSSQSMSVKLCYIPAVQPYFEWFWMVSNGKSTKIRLPWFCWNCHIFLSHKNGLKCSNSVFAYIMYNISTCIVQYIELLFCSWAGRDSDVTSSISKQLEGREYTRASDSIVSGHKAKQNGSLVLVISNNVKRWGSQIDLLRMSHSQFIEKIGLQVKQT